MHRKPQKPTGQKIAEEYFPVNEGDLKYAVEKEYKKPDRKSLEKVVTSQKKGGESVAKRGTSKKILYTPAKINLKKDGYELIITEKPRAALKIASALGKHTKKNIHGVGYYEVDRDGKKIIVACAVGHLLTLTHINSDFPAFNIIWVPNYLIKKGDFTKKYYETLSLLAKKAESLTVATDYDVEGEVIGWNVVRFICGQQDANRMKFSTLTPQELIQAYEEKSPNINWGQAIAGETRHYLDWFYGINLSRALMNAIKKTGRFKIMSIGRVQGPTLNIVVQKERNIQQFKSKKYWQIFATFKNSHALELMYEKDIFDKKQLDKFKYLKGKGAQAQTKKEEKIIPPEPPFNLTTLQTEAYKFYSMTPSRTLQTAQSLYLSGLISYPRTSSQKLPISIQYESILKKLAREYKAEKLITRKKPIEGKKTDPAHPSIYPTGQNENSPLSKDEQRIYDLIVRRFISLFCDNAKIYSKTVSAIVDGLKFSAKGSSIKEKAWMSVYPVKIKEKEIPDLEGEVRITKVRTEEKETQPPKRYSPASIISELEKRNLGTKATRTSIIETLYDRGYVKEKNIHATPLGISLISTLEKYSPIIIDEQLTRHFEKEMGSVMVSKKDFKGRQQKIIEKAKETIKKIIEQFNKKEKEIGKELLIANNHLIEQEKEENTLNLCPVCKNGSLVITYSKKNKRHFVACNAYPKCKTTYTLPPNGLIKKTDPLKQCEQCGFPMLIRLSKGKRPWIFCFNPQCPTNKKRIEEYKMKRGNQE